MSPVPRNAFWERNKMADEEKCFSSCIINSQNQRIVLPVKNQSGKKNSYEVNLNGRAEYVNGKLFFGSIILRTR